jgi:hypothetical protein
MCAQPVQRQPLPHQPHHALVAGDVGGAGEVDGAGGEFLTVLLCTCNPVLTEFVTEYGKEPL